MDATDPELLKVERRLSEAINPPAIAGALLLHLVLLAWCWGDWTTFFWVLGISFVTLFVNGPPITWTTGRLGRARAEAIRSTFNAASIVTLGHIMHWALPVWAFLTFFALPFDGFADRRARLRLALQVGTVAAAGLLDGGSPWFGLTFTLLALLAYLLAEVRTRVIKDLYVEARAQRDALDEAHNELRTTNRKMNELSRRAGMAEVATGILHNVGNTLNSVNVSAGMLAERVRQMRLEGLNKVNHLLLVHSENLASFLTEDPKGRQVPRYLAAVAEDLEKDQQENLGEIEHLVKKVDHIKAIVALQQEHAGAAGMTAEMCLATVIDDALQLQADSLHRHGITLERSGDERVWFTSQPHKILQILVNLMGNARHALNASSRQDKQLTLRVTVTDTSRIQLEVTDNGIGIPLENLPRVFSQGFTTKRTGHGFGLHMSAISAKSLGGVLSARSGGAGQGATFTLELPLNPAAGMERAG